MALVSPPNEEPQIHPQPDNLLAPRLADIQRRLDLVVIWTCCDLQLYVAQRTDVSHKLLYNCSRKSTGAAFLNLRRASWTLRLRKRF